MTIYYIYGFPFGSWRSQEQTNSFQSFQRNYDVSRTDINPENNASLSFSVDEFYSLDLTENPEEASKLSYLLNTRQAVVNEAQRIHMNIFKPSLLGRYKYAMLLNLPDHENKGDSAIVVGEMNLLRKLNIKVIYTCEIYQCGTDEIERAEKISKNYTNEELVILLQGGGALIRWPDADYILAKEIPRFMRFEIVLFPESIVYIKPQSHIDFCKKVYASHPRLTFVWRDRNSFNLGRKLFPKVHSLLAPDMAFHIGSVPRFMTTTFDILWIKCTSIEAPIYEVPDAPKGYRMHVSDWVNWITPKGTSPMENAYLRTTTGMTFLQRGRIVITDRLHGHILSTLLGIPHIYIDNKQRKISNNHNTWTAGIENIVLAQSASDAIDKATKLLIKLDKDLPEIKGFYL